MYRYEGHQTALTIAFHRGLYLASIILDSYERPQTALTIALHGGLDLAIIIDRYEGPKLSLYSLAWRPLISHYIGTL
jgi:hypothetical protein